MPKEKMNEREKVKKPKRKSRLVVREARIRSIKPELFNHEELFDAEMNEQLPLRLAFIALFTCCDREGRFRWQPRRLKLDMLPYDEVDITRVLDALMTHGFILKYEHSGKLYGCIPSWQRHQKMGPSEPESLCPPPEESTLLEKLESPISFVPKNFTINNKISIANPSEIHARTMDELPLPYREISIGSTCKLPLSPHEIHTDNPDELTLSHSEISTCNTCKLHLLHCNSEAQEREGKGSEVKVREEKRGEEEEKGHEGEEPILLEKLESPVSLEPKNSIINNKINIANAFEIHTCNTDELPLSHSEISTCNSSKLQLPHRNSKNAQGREGKGSEVKVREEKGSEEEGKISEDEGKEEKGNETEGKGVINVSEKRPVSPLNPIEQIFEHWKRVMNHPTARLDDKRKGIIKKALSSGYSVQQLCYAITGCSLTPHNVGDNERGERYDGLHVILRDSDQIDRFMHNYHYPPHRMTEAERKTQANVNTLQRWMEKKMQEGSTHARS